MTKTDNKKYVNRGADLIIEYDPEWEDDVKNANEQKVGAPYQYSESLIMLAAALRAGLGVPYRQLEGMIGKFIGEANTPSFSQLYKRINRLDVDIDHNKVVTVSDKKSSRILAVDATGLKQNNRGEWMRAKWKKKRGFVKMHVLVDTQTMKILSLSVTDDSVGDSTEFKSLLGQVVNVAEAKEGSDGTIIQDNSKQDVDAKESSNLDRKPSRSGDPESPPPNSTDDEQGTNHRILPYKNHLASGVSPTASIPPDLTGDSAVSDLMLGDAAYGSKDNVAACVEAGMTSGIMHKINLTAEGEETNDAWAASVRDQLGGSPDVTHLDQINREEKRENQTYWKAKIGYNMRWVAEGVFSIFKRVFGEHVMAYKWDNIVREVRLKVALYNKWRDESIARELG